MCTTYLFDEKHMSEDNFACMKKEIEQIIQKTFSHLCFRLFFKFYKIPNYLRDHSYITKAHF